MRMAASETRVDQRRECLLGALAALCVCLLVAQVALSIYNRQDIVGLQDLLRELEGQQHGLKGNISALEAQLASCRQQTNPFAGLFRGNLQGKPRLRMRRQVAPQLEASPGYLVEEAISRIVNQKLSDAIAKGALNISGPPGPRGPSGPAGMKGDAGMRGPKGDGGEKGSIGDPGAIGAKGEMGEKGRTGDPGLIGPKGPLGARGLKGDAGEPGPRGEKGEKGEAVQATLQRVGCNWKKMVQPKCVRHSALTGMCTDSQNAYEPSCPVNQYVAGVRVKSITDQSINELQCCRVTV